MRGKDHWRIVGILPPELRDREASTFEDVVPSVRNEAGAGLSFQACTWFSTYRIHHRARDALSRPPLLPARRRGAHPQPGRRAGHEHRPAGCLQPGVEAGAGRAGRADAALLDSYEEERIPVARRLLNTTDRALPADRLRQLAGRAVAHAGPGPDRGVRDAVEAGPEDCVSHGLADGHPLSEERAVESTEASPRESPQPGDRFPWLQLKFSEDGPVEDSFQKLDDTHFNLIVIGQPATEGTFGLGDLLRVHVIPADPANDAELARARFPSLRSTWCAPTAMSGLRERAWTLPWSNSTSLRG